MSADYETADDFDGVLVRRSGPESPVAELVLNRPEAMNAISTAQARAIIAATDRLATDASVRAVVVSSSHEKAFCVGADLKERADFDNAQLAAQRPDMRAAFGGVLHLPVPVIAAVGGYALGGGFELALSCDLIVAGEGATFALPEVSVGLVPGGGGTQLLVRRIGANRAADLVYTARRVGGPEAERLGFVDRLVVDGSARREALELAEQIATNSPVGVRAAKRAMRRGADADLNTGLEIEDGAWRETAYSADRPEGIRAFVEKRRPNWPRHGI